MGISRPAQATVIYPARGGGGSGKVAASATAAVENDISDVILRGGEGGLWKINYSNISCWRVDPGTQVNDTAPVISCA